MPKEILNEELEEKKVEEILRKGKESNAGIAISDLTDVCITMLERVEESELFAEATREVDPDTVRNLAASLILSLISTVLRNFDVEEVA